MVLQVLRLRMATFGSSSLFLSNTVLCQYKRTYPGMILKRSYATGDGPNTAKAILRLFRLRYILPGSAAFTGMYVTKKYNELKEQVSGTSEFFKRILPNEDTFDNMIVSFRDIRNSFPETGWFKDNLTSRFKSITDSFTGQALNPTTSDGYSSVKSLGSFQELNSVSVSPTFELQEEQTKKLQELEKTLEQKVILENERQNQIDRLGKEIHDLRIEREKEAEKLHREIRELRRQLLNSGPSKLKQMKASLIDMYSEVLDQLSDFDTSYRSQDHLPRVVVIGDQSAGKTSVLEMIVQARIFPRGAGKMMTKSPVKVTLSEGPYHVAKFKNGNKEFDLTNESDLQALRNEIEERMDAAVKQSGSTISTETISLSVQGPGLHKMVLVDLPGLIVCRTAGMSEGTGEAILDLAKEHMKNPNSIILCIQDGGSDPERNAVTQLAATVDPQGKRTIFVLTKMDMVEDQAKLDVEKMKSIMSGKLFCMKAMGYFAVVTGRSGAGSSNDSIAKIKEYEETFFKKSKLLQMGALKSDQMSTGNLSRAVSEMFWKMVKSSIEQQTDQYRAIRFNLETEWKNTFPKKRQLDRLELFGKAREQLLDEMVHISDISSKRWEESLKTKLWKRIEEQVFNKIFLPAAQANADLGSYQTKLEIALQEWGKNTFPKDAVHVGWDTLYSEFRRMIENDSYKPDHDPLFDALKFSVQEESCKRHTWDEKAEKSLHLVLDSALLDRIVPNKEQWNSAVKFMEEALKDRLSKATESLNELRGPSSKHITSWLFWKTKSDTQRLRGDVLNELEKLLQSYPSHGSTLADDEVIAIRKNLQAQKVGVDDQFIRDTWQYIYNKQFLERVLSTCYDCRKSYYYYQQGFLGGSKFGETNANSSNAGKQSFSDLTNSGVDCREVEFFWRLSKLLEGSSVALRQQITNNEARRLETVVKQVLEEYREDKDKLKLLLTGRRVELAEDLKRVKEMQIKLEEFIEALKKEA